MGLFDRFKKKDDVKKQLQTFYQFAKNAIIQGTTSEQVEDAQRAKEIEQGKKDVPDISHDDK